MNRKLSASVGRGHEFKANESVFCIFTREYTISVHKHVHRAGSKKCVPRALEEVWEFAMKENGSSGSAL